MRISSTNAIEGRRVLYTIGRIEAASTWQPAHGSPCTRTGGSLFYSNSFARPKISTPTQSFGSTIRIDETRVKLKRVVPLNRSSRQLAARP
jgi:hypothetical protein